MTDVAVHEAVETSAELHAALARLLPQLWDAAPPLTAERLAGIVAAPATRLLVATDGGQRGAVCGMAIVVVAQLATGVKTDLEDVVVDAACRGRGIGRLLSEAAIALAREQGAQELCLTSHPTRVEANRLYRSLGFELRDTNAYALAL